MWFASLNERFRCFAVILGQSRADMVRDLKVHAVAELAVDGAVEVSFIAR